MPTYRRIVDGSWAGLTSAEIKRGRLSVQVLYDDVSRDYVDHMRGREVHTFSLSAWVTDTDPLVDSLEVVSIKLADGDYYSGLANITNKRIIPEARRNQQMGIFADGTFNGYVSRKARIDSTDDRTLSTADSGEVHTNYGAEGEITYTLPSAPESGKVFTFINVAGQTMNISPGTDDGIYTDADGDGDKEKQANNKDLISATAWDVVTLQSDASADWANLFQVGTGWSVGA